MDIVLPEPGSWWPPAPGWIWVAALILVLAIAWIVLAWLRWRQNAYRREAVAELAATDLTADQMFEVLKRVALVSYGRSEVARLSGIDWLRFLADSCPGLNAKSLEPLYASIFSRTPASNSGFEEGLQAARQWVRHHRVSADPRSLPNNRSVREA